MFCMTSYEAAKVYYNQNYTKQLQIKNCITCTRSKFSLQIICNMGKDPSDPGYPTYTDQLDPRGLTVPYSSSSRLQTSVKEPI